MKEFINKINSKNDLSLDEMRNAINSIMTGQVDDVEIESFLIGLNKKGISESHRAQIGHHPSNILLVGDTVHDEEVAIQLGVKNLLFTGGHNSPKALDSCVSELTHDLRQVLHLVID